MSGRTEGNKPPGGPWDSSCHSFVHLFLSHNLMITPLSDTTINVDVKRRTVIVSPTVFRAPLRQTTIENYPSCRLFSALFWKARSCVVRDVDVIASRVNCDIL